MIGKYLDIYTSHLSKETFNNLKKKNIERIFSYDYPEGIFIVVPDEPDYCQNIPDDLDILFKYARNNEVSFVWLAYDGEEIDELPTYGWESPEETFLEQPAFVQENALMETAMRIHHIFDYLKVTGEISVNEDPMYLLEIFREMAREFEYLYYDTERYTDDYINFTHEYFTTELMKRFGKEISYDLDYDVM